MKIGCIIQARLTSNRLAKKVLLNLPFDSNITVLEQVIRRVKKSKKIDEIIIATTINEEDDPIIDISKKERVKYYRGSEENVLSRYYLAAKENNLDMIIRITSDCPCIDSNIIDDFIEIHIKNENDYTTNALKRTYPHGLDIEIFNFNVIEEAHHNSKQKYEIEHVTPYIYKSNPEKFKIQNIEAEKDLYGPNIRITLDTELDYKLLSAIYDYLYDDFNSFTAKEIVELFKNKNWLFEINNNVSQKKVCKTLDEEIEESLDLLKKQDLDRAYKYLKEKYYG